MHDASMKGRMLRNVLLILVLSSLGANAQWLQKGKHRVPGTGDENIEAHFGTSVDLSASGDVMVMAAQAENDTSYVRVYEWTGSYWTKRGARIKLEWNPWSYKNSVSISADGNAVALTFFDPLNGDLICEVYDWYLGAWSMRGEPMIDTQPCYLNQGKTLEITPDGNTVVLSSQSNGGSDDMLIIYDWVDAAWIARTSIDPGALAGQGYNCSVSESASSVVIATLGSYCEDSSAFDSWNVKVYDWTGVSWNLRGFGISEPDGNSCGIYTSISLDGNTVAVSTPPLVRIYDWSGSQWLQRSNAIATETSGSGSGSFVVSNPVDLSWDGNTFAVGIPMNDSAKGQVRVYSWTGTGWLKLGEDLTGKEPNDHFGYSIALSANGLTLAVGAPDNDSIDIDAGMVTAYRYYYTADLSANLESVLHCWPNPTNGMVYFGKTINLVEVYNLLGDKLISFEQVTEIDLSRCSSGIYILRSDSATHRLIRH